MVEFTVYGAPRPAGSKRAFVRGGRAMVVDANPEAKPWKQEVTEAALIVAGGSVPVFADGPVSMRLRFVMRRPRSHFGAYGLKPSAPHCHSSRPDALKLTRAVEDALSGVVYRDDAQIAWQLVEKVYGEPERVEIQVGAI